MKEKLYRFMSGRYGVDELSRFLNIVIIGLYILSLLTRAPIWLATSVLLVYNYYRILSRDTARRYQENRAYLTLKRQLTAWISKRKRRLVQMKDYRFYQCPSCRQTVRVPKGKGAITITCPKCLNAFDRKS